MLDGDTTPTLPNDGPDCEYHAPVAAPAHGVLTLNADGTFSYTHDGSENFSDSFTYIVSDDVGNVGNTDTGYHHGHPSTSNDSGGADVPDELHAATKAFGTAASERTGQRLTPPCWVMTVIPISTCPTTR